ncbi:MAG: DUF1566 domain-containing protein [Spirochaetales bacterium]|nr:DUF1566 domain-containing protein [Spirochaetales bacterium]
MKRSVSVIASLVMMLLLLFCLVSCGGGGGDSGESSSLSYAFSVGDKSYMTLEDAVASVSTKSARKAVSEVTYVIRMLRDTTDPGATISGIDANIKLDFQDFTFTLSSGGVGIVIDNENGSVEIAGGKILVNEGSTLSSGSAVITIKSDVTITGTNVEVKAGLDAIETTAGELVIEGSTKITTTEGSKAIDAKENSKIEVNSDSVEFTGGLSISGTANVDLGEGTFHFTSEVTIEEGASLAGNKDKMDVPGGDTAIINIIENNVHEHSYDKPVWKWSEDYSTATATFTCSDDSTHVKKTIDATITTDSKTEPTCTEAGSATYTATVSFNGNTYTDTVEMNIPVLGHEYGDPVWTWSEDYSSVTATFTCGRVKTHSEVVTTEASNETVKTPTCTEAGTIKYTANVKLDEKTYTDIKTVDVSALGHKYGDPVWTWSEDYSSATASFTCSNDNDHVENIKAAITTDSKIEPTCTETGSATYTATVSFNGNTYTDTAEMNIPVLGHEYGDPVWTWAKDYSLAIATFTCSNDNDHVENVKAEITTDSTSGPTCTEDGSATYTASVSFNGKTYTDTVETNIPVLGHEYGDPVWTWSEDYSSATATFTCGRIKTHVEIVNAKVSNETVKTPTCTETGTIKYTANVKLDEKTYTDIKTVEVSALGHKYGDPAWTWAEDYSSATATFTCSNDNTHVKIIDAAITADSKTEPTCTEAGSATYTATVSFNGNTYTDTVEMNIPVLGHEYGDPVWTWSEDYSSATATFTCGRIKTHVEVVNAKVSNETVKTPTCTEDGSVTYTATFSFNDKTYADTKILTLKATGHTFSEDWASNSTHHWHAATCGHDVVSDKAEHTFGDLIVRTEATAQADGLEYRTCTVCGYEETRSIPRKSAVDIEDDIAKNPKIVLTSSPSKVLPGKSVSISANVDNITEFEFQWVVGSDINPTGFDTATDGKVDDFTSVFNLEGTYDISLYIRKAGIIWSESIEITVSNTYIVGEIGPSSGYVFYDCDADNDTGNADGLKSSECGWRYLEAAPSDLRIVNGTPTVDSTLSGYSNGAYEIYYGYYRESDNGSNLYVNGTVTHDSSNCTGTAIGTGKKNTELLTNVMGDATYSSYSFAATTTNYAARLCDILEYTKDGVTYKDWFLPSKDELNLMYTNLHKQGLGDFEGNSSYNPIYWSSSEDYYYGGAVSAWGQGFDSGSQDRNNRKNKDRVRPVRAFI